MTIENYPPRIERAKANIVMAGMEERITLLEGDAADVLKTLGARELAREEIDGMTVIYAFSPRISAYETLRYGRVNVMIAVRGARLVVGSPLIKGSY